jgi:hypothetical protein
MPKKRKQKSVELAQALDLVAPPLAMQSVFAVDADGNITAIFRGDDYRLVGFGRAIIDAVLDTYDFQLLEHMVEPGTAVWIFRPTAS